MTTVNDGEKDRQGGRMVSRIYARFSDPLFSRMLVVCDVIEQRRASEIKAIERSL